VPVCKADDATVTTYLGSEGSTFEKVKSPSNANKLIEMKTLWEANLDPFVSDMNDNDHNLLLVGDDLYLYVEHYTVSSIKCYLRQFDASDGSYKELLTASYPKYSDSVGYESVTMVDDAGNILLLRMARISYDWGQRIRLHRYDMKSASFVDCATVDFTSDFLRGFYEPNGCTGDVTSGNLTLSLGAWSRTEVVSNGGTDKYAIANVSIAQSYKSLDVNSVVYSSNASVFDIPMRSMPSTGAYVGNFVCIKDVDESTQLVQVYGSDYDSTDHSPVILYQKDDAGNWIQKDKLVKIGDETVPYTTHCFGAFPVKLGDEELLILPYQFDSKNGTTFKVLHWADVSTLSSGLTELWSFPNQNLPFAYAKDTDKIYKAERPKVLVSTYKNADGYDEAKVYAYMPGSFLGAYTIALSDEETAASTVTVSQDAADATYTLEGRSLTVNPDNASEQSPLQVVLYNIAGQCVLSKTVTDSSAFTEDLTSLTPGIYLLRLNSATTKLALQ
jgi:hypothetical protein